MAKLLEWNRWEIRNSSLYQIWRKWLMIKARYGNAELVVNSRKPKRSYIEYCKGIGI